MLKLEFTAETPEALTAVIKDYVSKLKGTRGGKAGDENDGAAAGGPQAPQPLQPQGQTFNPGGPQAGFQPGGFAPPAGGVGPAGAGFPAAVAPEVLALVARITPRIDASVVAGANPEQMLGWFRNECVKGGVAEAANATIDQIKTVCLFKLGVPALDGIAKMMNA